MQFIAISPGKCYKLIYATIMLSVLCILKDVQFRKIQHHLNFVKLEIQKLKFRPKIHRNPFKASNLDVNFHQLIET